MKKQTANRVEAYGAKGMKSTPWRKEFKSVEAAYEWAETHDAMIHGVRELEQASTFSHE